MRTKIIAPDYKKIFRDIIEIKYPDKKKKCRNLLNKKELSTLDIIKLNQEIFETKDKETLAFNKAHRSYHPKTIIEILDYQKKNNLNDSQLAMHFNISRNSIRKWKKLFKNNFENI
jgi:DNA-binding transcriptional regulator YiaG